MELAKPYIRKITPRFIIEKYHYIRIQRRFRGGDRRIDTNWVSLSAQIGLGVSLSQNVDVRDGVIIQDYSYCNRGAVLFNNTIIGKFCSIGYNVQIGCPEHPVHFFSTSPQVYRNKTISKYIEWPAGDYVKPSILGNDIWVGSNAIILQGVEIGDGAIIAAGAVVTKDVDPYTIVGGVPAKVIGKRFDADTEKTICESKWWDFDMKEIERFAVKIYSKRKEAVNENSSINSD